MTLCKKVSRKRSGRRRNRNPINKEEDGCHEIVIYKRLRILQTSGVRIYY